MTVMSPGVFDNPPEEEQAHRSFGPRLEDASTGKPSPFIIKFLHFQEKEKGLRWARQHKLDYRGSELRVYPDISAALARKRAALMPLNTLFT